MTTNSFISHRLFVAALNNGEAQPDSTGPVRGRKATKLTGSVPRKFCPGQSPGAGAQTWLDFPSVRGMELSVS